MECVGSRSRSRSPCVEGNARALQETMTPEQKRHRQALRDITSEMSPQPLIGNSFGTDVKPPPPSKRAGTQVQLQRFTLLSRSAAAVVCNRSGPPKYRALVPPSRFASTLDDEVPICQCSWTGQLQQRHRRLCKKDTNQHEEYLLLLGMNKKFVADCDTGGELLLGRACDRDFEVHLILDNSACPAVLGYLAVVRSFQHDIIPNMPHPSGKVKTLAHSASKNLTLLAQVFVETSHRRRGVATAALRELLIGQSAVVVDGPTRATLLALKKLGFELAGVRAGSEGQPLCLLIKVAESGC